MRGPPDDHADSNLFYEQVAGPEPRGQLWPRVGDLFCFPEEADNCGLGHLHECPWAATAGVLGNAVDYVCALHRFHISLQAPLDRLQHARRQLNDPDDPDLLSAPQPTQRRRCRSDQGRPKRPLLDPAVSFGDQVDFPGLTGDFYERVVCLKSRLGAEFHSSRKNFVSHSKFLNHQPPSRGFVEIAPLTAC